MIDKDKQPEIHISSKVVNEGINILIKDNGIGIAEDQKESIFGTFKRLNSKDKYEGSGLGLSLCQKIVQFWDGDIKVDSELGKGTTFQIFIPNEVLVN